MRRSDHGSEQGFTITLVRAERGNPFHRFAGQGLRTEPQLSARQIGEDVRITMKREVLSIPAVKPRRLPHGLLADAIAHFPEPGPKVVPQRFAVWWLGLSSADHCDAKKKNLSDSSVKLKMKPDSGDCHTVLI